MTSYVPDSLLFAPWLVIGIFAAMWLGCFAVTLAMNIRIFEDMPTRDRIGLVIFMLFFWWVFYAADAVVFARQIFQRHKWAVLAVLAGLVAVVLRILQLQANWAAIRELNK